MSTQTIPTMDSKMYNKYVIFGQEEAASKDYYKKRQVTEILTIEAKKLVLFDKVSLNYG